MKALFYSICFVVLASCVPTMPAPPASPLDAQHTRSAGVGYTAHQMLAQPGWDRDELDRYHGGQFWLRRKSSPTSKTEMGFLASVGMTSFASAGTYVRQRIGGTPDGLYVGTQFEGGWLWAGAGLPVAVRLSDGVWAYVQPTIRAPAYVMAHLPFGLSVDLGESMRLDAQGGASGFGMLIGKSTPGSPIHSRMFAYGGIGLSRHW